MQEKESLHLPKLNAFLASDRGKAVLDEYGLVLVEQKPFRKSSAFNPRNLFRGTIRADVFRTKRTFIFPTVWERILTNIQDRKDAINTRNLNIETLRTQVIIARKGKPKQEIGEITTTGYQGKSSMFVMHFPIKKKGPSQIHEDLQKFAEHLGRHFSAEVTHSAI